MKNFNVLRAIRSIDRDDDAQILALIVMIFAGAFSVILFISVFIEFDMTPKVFRELLIGNLLWVLPTYFINTVKKV